MNLSGNGLGDGGQRVAPSLHVAIMAGALVIAAFLGAGIGFLWQSAGLDQDAKGAKPGVVAAVSDASSAQAGAGAVTGASS